MAFLNQGKSDAYQWHPPGCPAPLQNPRVVMKGLLTDALPAILEEKAAKQAKPSEPQLPTGGPDGDLRCTASEDRCAAPDYRTHAATWCAPKLGAVWRAGADIQSAALAPCAGCGPRVVENTPDPDEASSSFVIEWAEWLTRLQTKEATGILRQGRVMGRLSDSPGHRPKTEPMGRCSNVDPLLLGTRNRGSRPSTE